MSWIRTVFVPAFAKINLTLEVLGRRDDGYHDLASVMQTISLHDTLALSPAPAGAFALECDVTELATPDNLALRAARAVAAACQVEGGVRVELRKQIPTQAGLGGGSSDAAAVLLALPRLWAIELPPHRLTHLAAELGSDVPYFLTAGAAMVAGRGERVAPLPDPHPRWIVLSRPPVAVPTGKAFAALTAEDYMDGSQSAALAHALGGDGTVPAEHLVNSFARSAERAYSPLAALRDAFVRAGASSVHLSGSGPTLFALFDHLRPASETWQRLRAGGHEAWLAHTVARDAALAATRVHMSDSTGAQLLV